MGKERTEVTDIEQRCQAIQLILSDVDGVLTDGGLVFDDQGLETKKFHARDGLGIALWQRAGFPFGILTARTSNIVRLRAAELGMAVVRQGAEDKLVAAREIFRELGMQPEQVCYVGDDLTDLPVVGTVGLGVAVADAVEEMREAAHLVTTAPGGAGAMREVIEILLKAKDRWRDVIRRFVEHSG